MSGAALLAVLVAAAPSAAPATKAAPATSADAGACVLPPPPDLAAIDHALKVEEGDFANQVSSGPRTGQAALRARLPVMPGALTRLVDISDGMVTYGVPMNLAEFETEASATQVLEYYARYFQERGWDISGPQETKKVVPYPAISATSGPEGLQLSVMVMGRAPKGSTVILGLADMAAVKAKGASAWKERDLRDLPFYPQSDPMVLSSQDGEIHSLTVNFDTADPLDKVTGFFRKEMAGRGYQEAADPMPADDRVTHLQFLKPGHAWTLALSPRDGRTLVTAQGTEE